MTNYEKLIEALRMCQFGSGKCPECSYYGQKGNWPEDCDDKMHRDAAAAIEALQSEVKRLEPKRGEWISDRLVTTNGGTYGVRRCSACEAYYQDVGYGWNYCPNCGADMRAKMEVQDGK